MSGIDLAICAYLWIGAILSSNGIDRFTDAEILETREHFWPSLIAATIVACIWPFAMIVDHRR